MHGSRMLVLITDLSPSFGDSAPYHPDRPYYLLDLLRLAFQSLPIPRHTVIPHLGHLLSGLLVPVQLSEEG